jgi:hypothetical protein
MAKRSDLFPSAFLKAADLNGEPLTVTIEKAPTETVKRSGADQQTTVLYFQGGKKKLPLNMTNWDSVADICGDDSDDWPGQQIELYVCQTENPQTGMKVDGIRVRAPEQGALPIKKPAATAKPDMDDTIPF